MKTFYPAEPRNPKYPDQTKGLVVQTNMHHYPILNFWDLTKKEQKDNDWDTEQEHNYVRYRGCVIPLENFMRNSQTGDWEGYAGDSFFSGTVIRFTNDGETCQLGLAYVLDMDPENPKPGYRVCALCGSDS